VLPNVIVERASAPDLSVQRLLAEQKALATGANCGTGKAVAIALGQAGADVIVNYMTDEAIRASNVEGSVHKADVYRKTQSGSYSAPQFQISARSPLSSLMRASQSHTHPHHQCLARRRASP
jgi:NAD(P)-dependent dehydrogenase (short-subunit alcohol dehydrogenase family)